MKTLQLIANIEVEVDEETLKKLGGADKARHTLLGKFCEEGARAVIRYLESEGCTAGLSAPGPEA